MSAMRAGDEVRVFSRSRHQPAPEGGWPGRVTRVGRKYATAEYETQDPDYAGGTRVSLRTVEFDIETGDERGDRTQTGKYARSPEQVERGKRRAYAVAALSTCGIELRSSHRLTTEQIEQLAAVVKTWDQEG